MAAIGEDLGADFLLYGKLERRKGDYKISLKLLNVESKSLEQTTTQKVPRGDLRSAKIEEWADKLYQAMVGVDESGTLDIDSNVDRATIYIDDKVATTLRDGSARVSGLSEGPHTVTIESKGHRTYEAEVVIVAGETEEISVSLVKEEDRDEDEEDDGKSLWKVAFVSGAVVTAGLAGGWAYNGVRVWSYENDKTKAWDAMEADGNVAGNAAARAVQDLARDRGQVTQAGVIKESCSIARDVDSEHDEALADFRSACDSGKSAANATNAFIVTTVLAAAATTYFGYQVWFADSGSSHERAARGDKKRGRRGTRMVIAPQIGQDSFGAGVRIDF
jgi:hypothetical protein